MARDRRPWKAGDWRLILPLALSGERESDGQEAKVGASIEHRGNRYLSYRVGYRYVWSLAESTPANVHREHRALAEFTLRSYPAATLNISDRNRIEYRVINGEESWRYRNRLRIERVITRSGDEFVTPYLTEEIGYDTRYEIFNRVRMSLGAEKSLSSRSRVDLYLAMQSDAQDDPPKRVIALGLTWAITL